MRIVWDWSSRPGAGRPLPRYLSVHRSHPDLATPQTFGAVGDGAAIDTVAISAWLNSGRPLTCAGSFRIDRPVEASAPLNGGLTLQGTGRHTCKIILTGTGRIQITGALPAGSDLSANALHGASQIILRDLGIEPAYAMSGEHASPQHNAAISISYPRASTGNPAGWTDPMVVVDNVSILPADAGKPTYAHYGLYLENVSNADVANVTCEGTRSGAIRPGSACIVYDGDASPVDTTIRNARAYFVDSGIKLSGTWQGVHILTPTIVAARVGIDVSAADIDSTLLEIAGGEINVSEVAIQIRNTTRTFIHDVHLNLIGASTRPDPACIRIAMSSGANTLFSVHDTICETYQGVAVSGLKYGVQVSAARPTSLQHTTGFIHGNLFSNAGNTDNAFVPIHLGPGTSDVTVGCNKYLRARTIDGAVQNVVNQTAVPEPKLVNSMSCKAETLPSGSSPGVQ